VETAILGIVIFSIPPFQPQDAKGLVSDISGAEEGDQDLDESLLFLVDISYSLYQVYYPVMLFIKYVIVIKAT